MKIPSPIWKSTCGLLGLFLLLASCQPGTQASEDDVVLASVHGRKLYLSELEGMFPDGASVQDSQAVISSYANRWIQDAIMLYEAERNIPKDLNIDQLVRDYRASLIRHNYEDQLVKQQLDSTITQAELLEFYEKNKEQYQLETPIIRCFFIKVPLPVENAAELRKWWNSNEPEAFEQLLDFSTQMAEIHILEDSTWHKVEDIAQLMPQGTLTASNVGARRDYSLRDEEYQYYLRVFEVKKQKEIAPLGFIEDQARKVILHSRKVRIMEERKQDMYERAVRRGNVQTYY